MFKRKALTDEEYVEQIRRNDCVFRAFRWGWFVLLIASVGCLFGFMWVIRSFTADSTDARQTIYVGLALRGIFGFLFVIIAAQAANCLKQWHNARHGFRTERLMLKYHDQLKGASNRVRASD